MDEVFEIFSPDNGKVIREKNKYFRGVCNLITTIKSSPDVTT